MYFLYIILAVMILLLMVTIHEFGHYISGRILGFKINEFSVGFGPAILQRTNKRGEKISLRIFPLGGYCAFEGEGEGEIKSEPENKKQKIDVFDENVSNSDNTKDIPMQEEKNKEKQFLSFNDQKPWKRIIVLLSGAMFNIISGFLFAIIFIAVAGNNLPVIGTVYESDNAQIIKTNDVIIGVNGKEINIINNFSEIMYDVKTGEEFVLTVNRNGVKTDLNLTKGTYTYIDDNGEEKNAVGIGISIDGYKRQGYNAFECVGYAFPFTAKMAVTILSAFGDLFRGIGLDQLSGPVGTVTVMAKLSQASALNILVLLPLLAVNLGIFNLFPIPMLDGSKVVFTTIEWIRGKPINRNVENVIHFVGFVLLIGATVLIDLLKFIL